MEIINAIDLESATAKIEALCANGDGKEIWDNVAQDWFSSFHMEEKDSAPFTKTDAFWAAIGEPILMGNDGSGYTICIVSNQPDSLKVLECIAAEDSFHETCKAALLYILRFFKFQEEKNQWGSREVFEAYKAVNPPILNRK